MKKLITIFIASLSVSAIAHPGHAQGVPVASTDKATNQLLAANEEQKDRPLVERDVEVIRFVLFNQRGRECRRLYKSLEARPDNETLQEMAAVCEDYADAYHITVDDIRKPDAWDIVNEHRMKKRCLDLKNRGASFAMLKSSRCDQVISIQ